MASIRFNNNYITVKANASIAFIDLDFVGANVLMNNTPTTAPVTGFSQKAVSNFKNNNPPPKSYIVSQGLTFPDGAHVTISGGGQDDNFIQATDSSGYKAFWQVPGV
ncbi:hypothetical protein F4813DRAFT_342287 [Daldinia decipiens]|uniref:uncharacterized protein n=1 Tax=Daldinia decipiens TaxID=326647 RepID=UPI0020C1C70C|nr:uncharacterized protein F4813DRAFT_342287 [Daldinia decipiens]KAI1662898.1 hypothetical protein F4813DRAFT_342287 [Daldinia decipiens]